MDISCFNFIISHVMYIHGVAYDVQRNRDHNQVLQYPREGRGWTAIGRREAFHVT